MDGTCPASDVELLVHLHHLVMTGRPVLYRLVTLSCRQRLVVKRPRRYETYVGLQRRPVLTCYSTKSEPGSEKERSFEVV